VIVLVFSEHRLVELRDEVVEKLDASQVAKLMMERHALTPDEVAAVENAGSRPAAADLLLKAVLRRADTAHDHFLLALRLSEQNDIYSLLEYQGYLTIISS
jgi:Caspase recruitment domain